MSGDYHQPPYGRPRSPYSRPPRGDYYGSPDERYSSARYERQPEYPPAHPDGRYPAYGERWYDESYRRPHSPAYERRYHGEQYRSTYAYAQDRRHYDEPYRRPYSPAQDGRRHRESTRRTPSPARDRRHPRSSARRTHSPAQDERFQQLEAQLRNLSAVTENLSRVQTAQLVVQPAPQAPQGAKPANQPTRTQASQDAKPAQAQAPTPRMNSSKHASRDARSYPNLPSAPQQDLSRQPLGGIPVPGVAPTYASAARTAASSAAPAVNLAPTRERHPWLLEMDEIFAIDFPDDYRRVMPASWGTRWDRDHLVFATKQGLEDGAYPGICQNIFGARRNGCKEGTKCKLQHTWFVREDLLCYASNPDPVKLETSKNWLREAVHNVIANYKRGHVDPNHPLPIPPRTGRLPPYVPRRATASSVTPAPTPATARGDTPAPATARGDTRATAGGDTPTNGGQAPARPRDATTGDSARSRGSSPAGAFVPPTGGIEDFCNDLESETPIPPNPASRWNNFPRSIAADDREIAARNALRAAAFAATGQPPFLAREHYRSLSADGWRSTGTFAPIGSTHTSPDPRGSEYEGLPDYGAQPPEPHW